LLLKFCGEFERAHTLLEEALSRQQDTVSIMRSLFYQGVCPAWVGEAGATAAIPLLREGLSHARTLGDSYYAGVALFYLGMALQALGNAPGAASHYGEALELFDTTESLHSAAGTHFGLGTILVQQGDLSNAVRHVKAGLATSVTLRDRWLLSQGAQAALVILGDQADPARCARLLGASDALRQATGSGRVVWERETADQGWPERRERLTHGRWETEYRQRRSLPAGEVAALAARMLDELAQELSSTTPTTGAEMSRDSRHARVAAGKDTQRGSACVLTEREREVLRLVAQGLSSKAIGRQLFISSRTVSQHLSFVFNKLGVNTRAEAAVVAAHRGLISVG
jgi:DNA-binding CsgD family transcriptional regulator/tetratricopeptide (TPR) repeat protein